MKKTLMLILLATTLGIFNNSYANNNPDFKVEWVNITHGEQLENIDFLVCNYGDNFKSDKGKQMQFIFQAYKDNINNGFMTFNYITNETIFKKGECRQYNLDKSKLKLIVLDHYLDIKTSYYWTMSLISSLGNNGDIYYPSVGAVTYHTYKNNNTDEKNKYYGLIKDGLTKLLNGGYINQNEFNDLLTAYYNRIFSSTEDLNNIYNDYISLEKQQINNNNNGINETKDKYYILTKNIYKKLYTEGKLLSEQNYINIIEGVKKDIYENNSTPEKIYNKALELEKNINISTPYDLSVTEFSLKHDDNKVSELNFKICNIGGESYYGDINAFFKFDKKDPFNSSVNHVGNYVFKEKIDVNECKTRILNTNDINSIFANYPDYKYLLNGGFYSSIYVYSSSGIESNFDNNTRGAAMNYQSYSSVNTTNTNINTNNTKLPTSLTSKIDYKINSMSQDKRQIWIENVISKIDIILKKKSLSNKNKELLTGLKLYLQEYSEDFDIEELLK